jgi:hypothetical protein
MSSLREEIEAELKHVRLDKTALYNILLKMVDQGVGGGSGGPGLPGPAGPPSATPKTYAATTNEEKPKKKAAPKKKTLAGV